MRSLKRFSLYDVGPASQTVVQHYFTIGSMYRVIWVVSFMATGNESVTRIAIASVLCRNVGYVYRMLDCCWAIVRHAGSTLKQHWLTVQWLLLTLMWKDHALGQCWSSVEPASYTIDRYRTSNRLRLWTTLIRNWVGSCVRGTS